MTAATVNTVPRNALRNPETGNPVTAATAFAAWLQRNEPALFNALAQSAAKHAPGLGDWSSILSAIGSGVESIGSHLGSAAESVGNYLTSSNGMQALSTLANTYLQGQAAQQVTQLQLTRAQQGLAPAPVSYVTNSTGQAVPVYTGQQLPGSLASAVQAGYSQPLDLGNGQVGYTLNGQQLQALSGTGLSGFFQQYGLWIALGGGALIIGGLLLSRRR